MGCCYVDSCDYSLQIGSSQDPCSELYHGPHAASEPEVQAIANYIQENKPVLGAIDFHSYYQEILYPPGAADKCFQYLDLYEITYFQMRRKLAYMCKIAYW